MVKNKDFIKICLNNIKEIDEKSILVFKTFKKDRSISIEKISNSIFNVYENGFLNEKFENLKEKELKTILKKLQKIEFPNSNQIWFKIIKNK